MKKNENSTKLEIKMQGLNFERFLNNAIQNNIKIENISRKDGNVLFKIGKEDFNSIKTISNKNVDVEILKTFGLKRFIEFCLKRMGLLIGIVLSLALFFIFNSFILNINIMGNEYISTQLIEEKLSEIGVSKFKTSNFNSAKVEDYLLEQINDISMVSIKKIGTSVIVNVKEKLENTFGEKINLVSQYNMLITKIDVFCGTCNVKVGDIVKKGDILVYAYMEDGSGEIVNCEPLANIEGDVWFTSVIEFKNKTTELKRTGKKFISTNYLINRKSIIENKNNCGFENFEIEEKEFFISSFLLPLKVKKVIYYELEEITQEHDFLAEQDSILSDCYKNALSKVPKELVVTSEDVEINQVQDGYIVSVYLKSSVSIRSGTNES